MKLAFFVSTPVRFTVATPEQAPLGGTESCAAYLSRHLAARGHDVTLLATLPPDTPARLGGVRHVPMQDATFGFFASQDFDAVIALTMPGDAQTLKQAAPNAVHVAWLHLGPWEAAMASLPPMTPFIDCAVFVSEWHRAVTRFAGPSQVIGNAIAPVFENLFASAADLLAAKRNRALYASLPERGLDVLAEALALARVQTELEVYSGRSLYQQPDAPFPAKLAALPRARLCPPVGQAALAAAMRQAAFLTYPAIVPETWCIVAQEALAAGMRVISTAVGGLPESMMGFADLLALQDGNASLPTLFAARIEANVSDFLAQPQAWAEERFAQSQTITRNCNWAARAKAWEDFLAPAVAWKRGA